MLMQYFHMAYRIPTVEKQIVRLSIVAKTGIQISGDANSFTNGENDSQSIQSKRAQIKPISMTKKPPMRSHQVLHVCLVSDFLRRSSKVLSPSLQKFMHSWPLLSQQCIQHAGIRQSAQKSLFVYHDSFVASLLKPQGAAVIFGFHFLKVNSPSSFYMC